MIPERSSELSSRAANVSAATATDITNRLSSSMRSSYGAPLPPTSPTIAPKPAFRMVEQISIRFFVVIGMAAGLHRWWACKVTARGHGSGGGGVKDRPANFGAPGRFVAGVLGA